MRHKVNKSPMKMYESTVSGRGQITLSKCVREELGVVEGDQVRYVILDDNEVRIKKVGPIRQSKDALASETDVRVILLDEMDEEIVGTM